MPKTRDRKDWLPNGLASDFQPRRRAAGFTLIELMVVIFIVGLTATVVMISLPDGSREVRGDADRFAQRIAAARDEDEAIFWWDMADGRILARGEDADPLAAAGRE
ncbi:MAG: type II secretion system GspH family protein, partial [Sphingomonadales bacterium]|nr:type II secretion system GspH family protein [Sphingomonadales bacterium]